MRRINVISLFSVALLFVSGSVSAETATVDVISEGVQASDALLTIAVALPAEVVGKRISRAMLEVPIALNESQDATFNEYPLIELFQDGSEAPKQTILLEPGLNGIVRFNVTRFVREWSNTDLREFVLGAVSESNGTAFELGAAGAWPNGTKARLIIEYQDRDGTSVAADIE